MGGLEDRANPEGVATSPSTSSCDPGCWGDCSGLGWGTLGKGLTFCHAVQYHVNEDVGASSSCPVTETGDGDRLSVGPSRKGGGDRGDMEAWGREPLLEPLGWLGQGVNEPKAREQSQHRALSGSL